ncbi:MAG: chemotaxis protein CheW [Promethearchaeota archaeon]
MATESEDLSKKLQDLEGSQMDISNRFIIFQLNTEIIALSVKHVREVEDVEIIRVIPKLSKKFRGICNLRGEILPILNLSYCVFGKSKDYKKNVINSKKVIFINAEEETFGLLVDEIDDIVEFSDEDYENIPSIIPSQIPLQYIRRVVHFNGKTIVIINFLKVMEKNFSLYDGFFSNDEEFEDHHNKNADMTEDKETKKPKQDGFITQKQDLSLSFTENTSEKIRFELDLEQIDAFKEVTSIATCKIAEALTDLMVPNTNININILDVGVDDLSEFKEKHAFDDKLYIGIRSSLIDDFSGAIYLFLSIEGLKTLLDKIEIVDEYPDVIEDISDLDKDTSSAINEIGNIIISHYCSGLSDFLKLKMYHETPQIAIDEFNILIDGEIANLMAYSDRGIFSETSITINEKDIDGSLVFIPYYNSVEKFVKCLDVDRIVELLELESKRSRKKEKVPNEGKFHERSGLLSEKQLQTLYREEIGKNAVWRGSVTKTYKNWRKKKLDSLKPGKKEKKKGPNIAESIDESSKETSLDEMQAKLEVVKKNHSTEIMEKVVSQKNFKIDREILEKMDITLADLDSFREFGNIGAGNAGNILSQIIKQKVLLEIPPANILNITELIDSFPQKNRKRIGYMGVSTGFLEGTGFLLYNPEDLRNVLDQIFEKGFKKKIRKESDLSSVEKKGIVKLLDMLVDKYFKSLSDFLEIPFEKPKYSFFFKSPKGLLQNIGRLEDMVIIETNLHVETHLSMRGQFILLLNSNVIHRILKKMKEVWD